MAEPIDITPGLHDIPGTIRCLSCESTWFCDYAVWYGGTERCVCGGKLIWEPNK